MMTAPIACSQQSGFKRTKSLSIGCAGFHPWRRREKRKERRNSLRRIEAAEGRTFQPRVKTRHSSRARVPLHPLLISSANRPMQMVMVMTNVQTTKRVATMTSVRAIRKSSRRLHSSAASGKDRVSWKRLLERLVMMIIMMQTTECECREIIGSTWRLDGGTLQRLSRRQQRMAMMMEAKEM